MPVLITSDWHLNDKVRDRYRHDWQKQLRTLIRQHDVDTLLMLGDLTDDFDNHSATLVNEIINHFTRLLRIVEHTYIMRGNHDCVDPTTPFFKFVSAIEGITWVNSPCHHIVGSENILFLPHTRDYKADWADVNWQADLVLTHNTFAGTISESGHELGGIPRSAIPDGLKVIGGDIHKPQDTPITYVGSPYTIDFGDSFEPRVLLLHNNRYKSIPCRGPQKRLITAPSADAVLARLKTAGDDIVKLRVAVGESERANWPVMKRTILDEAIQLGVRVHSIEAVTDTLQTTKRYSITTKAKRDDEVFKEYCKVRSVEKEFVDEGFSIITGK